MGSELQYLEAIRAQSHIFWKKVRKTGPDDCWEWVGWRQKKAAGRLPYGMWRPSPTQKSTPLKAHRVAWTLINGPIPNGLCVCHRCDNPACCNPSHLWLGTASDNNKDRDGKGRTVPPQRVCDHGKFSRGSKHGMSKLTEDDILAILADNRPQTVIAAAYGVHSSNINHIKRGRTWRSMNV